jgi:hypothetical protein
MPGNAVTKGWRLLDNATVLRCGFKLGPRWIHGRLRQRRCNGLPLLRKHRWGGHVNRKNGRGRGRLRAPHPSCNVVGGLYHRLRDGRGAYWRGRCGGVFRGPRCQLACARGARWGVSGRIIAEPDGDKNEPQGRPCDPFGAGPCVSLRYHRHFFCRRVSYLDDERLHRAPHPNQHNYADDHCDAGEFWRSGVSRNVRVKVRIAV